MTGKFNKAFTDKTFTMKELPASEKPYEKCMQSGAGTLSDAELLAVILKTGARGKTSLTLATELLKFHPSYEGLIGLHHLSMRDLMQIKGIGRVKAIQILCVLELSKRLSRQTKNQTVHFSCPGEIAGYFMEEMRNLETEHLYAVFLDASGRLLGFRTVFVGTIQRSIVSPREILRLALQYDAAHFIILHNHPSGDPEPSPEDLAVTTKLRQVADALGIPLVDHIIIGDRQYVSLSERGYL